MKDWIETALAAVRAGEPAVLVTVCSTHGSAPRGPGAKMLIRREGQSGTIGGGNLEFTAAAEARAMLEADASGPVLKDYSLGPKLDQCCGGVVGLLFEPLDANARGWLEPAAEAAGQEGRAARLLTVLGAEPAKRLVDAEAAEAETGDAVVLLDRTEAPLAGTRVPAEEVGFVREALCPPRPVLYIFGAGHVGRAVARILATLPLAAVWVDSRPEAFSEDIPVNVTPLRTDDPAAAAADAPADALYLVFTHSHPLDFDITAAILARGDARYVGLIGSETKRARFVKRFRDDLGLAEDQIGRLTCPIGLGGPPGKEPEVIALGVAAEVMRAARGGGP